nr:hypothetical protein [Saprospiraceae bacterium]
VLQSLDGVDQGELLVASRESSPSLLAFYKGKAQEQWVRRQMESTLPDYMVPSKIIQLERFPQLPNGKIDQNGLLEVGERSVSQESNIELPVETHEFEGDLIKIWQDVLRVKEVKREQNYFELGGDSIKSIQIIALAREHGIKIGPAMIFKYPTVAELALFCKPIEDQDSGYAASIGRAKISPIQGWFFEEHRSAPHYWNQGQTVALREKIPSEKLYQCCLYLINHHDALRSSFHRSHEGWEVEFRPKQTHLDGQWHLLSGKNWSEAIRELQQAIRLDQDALIHFCIAEEGAIASFSIIAHHLVMDAVSWSLLLSDLERLITSTRKHQDLQLDPVTMGCKEWAERLAKRATLLPIEATEYWHRQVDEEINLPVAVGLPVREQGVKRRVEIITGDVVDSLFTDALVPFGNQVLDFLVLAVARSWQKWTGQHRCQFLLEGHGRDLEGIDVTHTIGWFTNFFPMLAELSGAHIGDQLKYLKEALFLTRRRGWEYGTLRYGDSGQDLPDYVPSQIVLNYLGDARSGVSAEFKDVQFLMEEMRDPNSERHFALEFNIAREVEGLAISLSYAEELAQLGVLDFLSGVVLEIRELVHFCLETEESGYTPSDFEEVDLSQDELDDLLSVL